MAKKINTTRHVVTPHGTATITKTVTIPDERPPTPEELEEEAQRQFAAGARTIEMMREKERERVTSLEDRQDDAHLGQGKKVENTSAATPIDPHISTVMASSINTDGEPAEKEGETLPSTTKRGRKKNRA